MNEIVGGALMKRNRQAPASSEESGAGRNAAKRGERFGVDQASAGVFGESEDSPSEEDLIARNLRTLFSSVEAEPLPPRLKALLDQLSEEEIGDPASDGDRPKDGGDSA